MIFQLRLNERSKQQYNEIVDWYAVRSRQAAENFITELEDVFDKIVGNPFRFRNKYRHFREVLLKRYPYYVIYFVNEEKGEIVVFSLYHSARDPKKKYRPTE